MKREDFATDVLGWGDEDFAGEILLNALHGLLEAAEIPSARDGAPESDHWGDDADALLVGGIGRDAAGFYVVALPDGLAVVPKDLPGGDATIDGDGWTMKADSSARTGDRVLLIRPGDVQFVPLRGADAVGDVRGSVELSRSAAPGEKQVLLGDAESSRLALKDIGFKGQVELKADELQAGVGLPASGSIVIDPDDLGGFLRKVLPADGITADFDVLAGWAADSGLYLDAGGTLEIAIPSNVDLGPIKLTEIYLGLGTADPGIRLSGATSGEIKLGPVTGVVTRVGISADVTFPDDGNLGILDLKIGFKPPDGIGLSIDAGAVTGGGFLEFEPEHDRYAGTLQLHLPKFSVNAVGLLTTRLPGGQDGYSLLILITGQDLGIQLGMGLKLDGIGGLLGVHRSMQAAPLREASRTGTLDSVLFPEDVVAHARRIISDLRSFFPPTADEYIIGPMLRIGWGTPTLVTGDLGVILQIPKNRIAILGRLSAVLPDEKAPIVELNMDALGVLSPPEKTMTLDATIYDSRVVIFALTGQMAMRSRWGDDPMFLLSIGGFHPEFEPPGTFPSIDRLKLSLNKGPLKLEVAGYFAITSNTVQTGAHIEAALQKGKWGVRGFLGLDALIRFRPEFMFQADFVAGIEITPIGISLKLKGHLSGPSPWRIRGKVKIKIVLVTIKISVKATIGPDKGRKDLPVAQVLPVLKEALEHPSNWSAQLPDGDASLVVLREVDVGEGEVLAHPLGTVGVRQTELPLDLTIDTFGNARPGDWRRFELVEAVAGATDDGDALETRKLKEHFAPAQYLELDDHEKMEKDGYERMPAGVAIGTQEAHIVGPGDYDPDTRAVTMAYETSVVDEENQQRGTPLADLGVFADRPPLDALLGVPGRKARAQMRTSAAALAASRTTGVEAFRAPDVLPEVAGPDEPMDTGLNSDLSRPVAPRGRGYVVSPSDELRPATAGRNGDRLSWSQADENLVTEVAAGTETADDYQVVPEHRLMTVGGSR